MQETSEKASSRLCIRKHTQQKNSTPGGGKKASNKKIIHDKNDGNFGKMRVEFG